MNRVIGLLLACAAPVLAAHAGAPPAAGMSFTSVQGGAPGGNASVIIQAPPAAQCTIDYVTPAGTDSTAKGLVPATVSADGSASWSWVIGTSTRPGHGTVTVNCTPGGGVSTAIAIGS